MRVPDPAAEAGGGASSTIRSMIQRHHGSTRATRSTVRESPHGVLRKTPGVSDKNGGRRSRGRGRSSKSGAPR
eukprot:7945510-Alexandrium_andersonii.AAC.1